MKWDWQIEAMEKRIQDLEQIVIQLKEMIEAVEKRQSNSSKLPIWKA